MKDADALANIIMKVGDAKEQLGEFNSCYCANGHEIGMRATSPMVRYQTKLELLVVGFIEERVGVNPLHPLCREPKYLMEQILLWRRPQSALNDLKGHLRDVSADKTQAIMACVHCLQAEAYKKAKAAFNKQVATATEEAVKSRLETFHGFLLSNDDDPASKDVKKNLTPMKVDMPGLYETFFQAQINAQAGSKRPANTVLITPTKKPKETRGEKKAEGRSVYKTLRTVVEKITYLDQVYDDNHDAYTNDDRHFLMRARAAVFCFRNCCNKDVNLFKDKHGVDLKNGGWTFHVVKIKGCSDCRVGTEV